MISPSLQACGTFLSALGSIPPAPTNISFVNNDFWIVEGPRGALAEVRHKNLY